MAQGSSQTGDRLVRDLAYVEVASSEFARDVNRDLVLERLRAVQPISRVDLARLCGLQPSTVSAIVEQLLGEGWICEGAVMKTARGRRPTMLSLNADLAMLVADVRPGHAVVAAVDLNGKFLSRSRVRLPLNPKQSIARIVSEMEGLRARYPDKRFEGVGLSVPGRVDPRTNRLSLVPNLPWKGVDISGPLSTRLGLPVELENDANACLLSELWFGRVDRIRNAVLIAISEGLGTAILAEGRLITGRDGLAGEFGHICVDPDGPRCGCGKSGCWEMYASTRAALEYYREISPVGEGTTFPDLVRLLKAGDKAAKQALNRQSVEIGRGLRMVNAALSPDVIFFAGDATMHWEFSRAIIERECRAGLLASSAPRLVAIEDGELGFLRGAAAVVLQRHSGYYRASHPSHVRVKPGSRPEPAASG